MITIKHSEEKPMLTPLTRSILVTLTYILPTILVSLMPLQSEALLRLLFIPVYLIYTWFLVRILDKQAWKVLELKITKRAMKGFLLALTLTALIVTLGTVIVYFINSNSFQETADFTLINLWYAFLSSFIVQGFPEEVVYRGYMEQTLRPSYKSIESMLIVATFFALMHIIHLFSGDIIYGLITVFLAFSFGLLASILKNLLHTTWAAVAVHGGFHLTRKLFEFIGLEVTSQLMLIYGILFFIMGISLFYLFRDRLKIDTI